MTGPGAALTVQGSDPGECTTRPWISGDATDLGPPSLLLPFPPRALDSVPLPLQQVKAAAGAERSRVLTEAEAWAWLPRAL